MARQFNMITAVTKYSTHFEVLLKLWIIEQIIYKLRPLKLVVVLGVIERVQLQLAV